MGLIGATVLAILSVLAALSISVASKIVADDAKAWLSWITKRLLDSSIRRLPRMERERYAEEWLGHIDNMPGDLAKLYVALGLLQASRSICASVNKESLPAASSRRQDVVHRAIDIVFAAGLLALFLPFLILISCLIGLESRGPILLYKPRTGRSGKQFSLIRFRTTKTNLDAFAEMEPSRYGHFTRVGAILRLTSCDELPQLINVIRGEVSLIFSFRP